MKALALSSSSTKTAASSLINKTAFIASCAYYTSKKCAIVSAVIIKADYKDMKRQLKNM